MLPAGWLLPQWDAPATVGAACSVRTGGDSAPPWDSLNLGDHVGDDPGAVARNRARYAQALGARPVFLQQVHATGVVRLEAGTPDGTVADACFTTARGVACTIMVADCLPVLFSAEGGEAVGAAHAGWRGLAGQGGQGVLESLVHTLGREAGVPPGALRAWLGPCIGPAAFEVGPEVREAFLAADPGAGHAFVPHGDGKFLADLPALARRRLAALGVSRVSGNDGTVRWCTVSDASRFFSHRRDRRSGRFAASTWLR